MIEEQATIARTSRRCEALEHVRLQRCLLRLPLTQHRRWERWHEERDRQSANRLPREAGAWTSSLRGPGK